jgi:hypothetical protein
MLPDALPEIDLGCPSTSVEYDVWRARIQVRTLIVALIVEARRCAFLTGLGMTLTYTWPTALGEACRPDALLQICWRNATVKPGHWLPWWPATPPLDSDAQYAVYLDRATGTPPLAWLQDASDAAAPEQVPVPVLVLHTEDRYRMIQQALTARTYHDPIRWSTWAALRSGVGAGQWRDALGDTCALTV